MERFGKLTAIKRISGIETKNSKWLYLCDCGKYKVIRKSFVVAGKVKSCGCLYNEKVRTHGLSKTKLYNVWHSMKERCYLPSNTSYVRYGARGITFCDSWKEFTPFYEWATANGYSEGLVIDRIDNNGNYEPNNCRWVTIKENNNNSRRCACIICPDGQKRTLSQLAEYTGLSYHMLRGRYWRNPAIDYDELILPNKRNKKHSIIVEEK